MAIALIDIKVDGVKNLVVIFYLNKITPLVQ